MSSFNDRLLSFLNKSVTPYHAVSEVSNALLNANYQRLDETEEWALVPNQGYFTIRNDASIIAFHTGNTPPETSGIRMAGAHTDSPGLHLAPNFELSNASFSMLRTETYGGLLMAPWFDRDLSVAGKICWESGEEQGQLLVNLEAPVCFIPSLAIHLNRTANKDRTYNPLTELKALVGDSTASLFDTLTQEVRKTAGEKAKILSHHLMLFDTQPSQLVGLNQEFIASPRIDNLVSCFAALEALLSSPSELPNLIVLNDHEEVGSESRTGAAGNQLEMVLSRWLPNQEARSQALAKSLLISADGAHATHPNYSEMHDSNHKILLNKGPVIKINANQRYATQAEDQAWLTHQCQKQDLTLQVFSNRTDLGCGSTIGPITSTRLGIRTLDMGAPQLGMHSIRELSGAKDIELLSKALHIAFTAPR